LTEVTVKTFVMFQQISIHQTNPENNVSQFPHKL